MDIPSDRVRIAFLGVGESKIELVEPTDDTTGVARFLASKGEGFHHVCFEVAEPRRDAAPPRDRRHRADRHGAAPRRRGPGRVPPPALVPRRARRADRGARRAGLGVARVLSVSRLRRQQREHQRQLAGRAGRQDPRAVAVLDEEVDLPVEERVLDERLDAQPGVDERGHDLAQAVVPAVLGRGRRRRRRVGVRALDREGERLARAPSTGRPGAARPGATPSFSKTWTTGWISVMKNVPPGARKWATTRAQARMSGSQPRTPREV